MTSDRIPVALLGAGIFAKTAHLPAIAACPPLHLTAIWSRSEASARSLLAAAESHSPPLSTPSEPLKIYFDVPDKENPLASAGTLQDLLASTQIKAVISALPIGTQTDVIKQVIKAGKSCFSEKPIAKDLEQGRDLIQFYEKEKKEGTGWIIAEQYPYEPIYQEAKKIIQSGGIGKLEKFSLGWRLFVEEGSKYYETPWRKVPNYQGGFLLDGGVHAFAGLRWILNPSYSLTSITGTATLEKAHLPPLDSLIGKLYATPHSGGGEEEEEEVEGEYSIRFGAEGEDPVRDWRFVGTEGSLRVDYTKWEIVVTHTPNGKEPIVTKSLCTGVGNEFLEFAKALGKGVGSEEWKEVEERSGVRSAMRDLGCVEGGLESKGEKVDLRELVGKGVW